MGDIEQQLEALRAERNAANARRAILLRTAIVQAVLRCDKDEERKRRAELAALEATEQSQ